MAEWEFLRRGRDEALVRNANSWGKIAVDLIVLVKESQIMSSLPKFVEAYINIYNTNSVLLIHHVHYIS
jgi:hypothetical protein